jgi:sarcosine oxidase subunit beta
MVGDVRIARSWTGIEAKTRDLLPVIGASPSTPGLFHVFGFSGHGFQLVPVVGAILCDLIVEGGTQRQIGGFAPERLMTKRVAA